MTRMLRLVPPICLGCLLLVACGELLPSGQQLEPAARRFGNVPKVTGDVEVKWMGGGSGAPTGEQKRAYADLQWFDTGAAGPDRSRFRYLVYNADGSLHREIIAKPTDDDRTGVSVDVENADAHFVGVVVYDSRTHANGGEETATEGGCSDGTDEGGCTDGHDEGTCEGGHDDGGCSGEEGAGCSGGSDEGGGPAHPPGNGTRETQIVAVVVHDGGSPGARADTITWSWFFAYDEAAQKPGAAQPPVIGAGATWSVDLCAKEILGGNLVVHSRSRK